MVQQNKEKKEKHTANSREETKNHITDMTS